MGTCTYTSEMPDHPAGEGGRACGNRAHRDGMCKFHLDGYLSESTAGEVRDLFWSLHDAGAAGTTMDCTGYMLPPLAREGVAASVGRALRLDRARFGPGGAGLSGITFEQPASLRSVEFAGTADFRGCTFKKGADFRGCTFKKGADFRGCTFKKGADFSEAKFRGNADFRSSRFGGTADFLLANFAGANFDWTVLGKSLFNNVVFRGDASFRSATFDSAAGFIGTEFHGASRFEESKFKKNADFNGAHFARPAYFRGVQIRLPELVRFNGNVSNVSFLNTDLKEVCFGSKITWSPQAQPDTRSIWDRKWRIYDERCLDDESSDPALNLENVQSVYRDLRDNFDRQLRYDVSGGFFVREMELDRKYKVAKGGDVVLKPICRRALTWSAAYNTLAEYGQSLKRPPLFLTPTLVAGSLLLWCGTGVLHGLETPCEEDLGDSVLRTLTAMVPLPLSGHLASPVDIGLKAAALPSVATFLIALRRRFEKTRRH